MMMASRLGLTDAGGGVLGFLGSAQWSRRKKGEMLRIDGTLVARGGASLHISPSATLFIFADDKSRKR